MCFLSCPFIFIFPEPFTQSSTAVIMVAVVVGVVILFIVFLVMWLCRRSVLTLLHYPPPSSSPCPSVCPVNRSDCTLLLLLHLLLLRFPLSFSRLSFRGGLRAASAFTLSSPLSVRLPFANFLFLFIWICVPGTHWGEEFAMNAPCHR